MGADATMTIDLNGHSISRVHSNNKEGGHVIEVRNNGNLTLTSTANDYGVIMGGKAINGGAIYIQHGNKVSANHVIFRNNSAAAHAGAIWNNGEFTATNCNFENNTAADVGAIYNAVESNVAGKVTLTNCTITGNTGAGGA